MNEQVVAKLNTIVAGIFSAVRDGDEKTEKKLRAQKAKILGPEVKRIETLAPGSEERKKFREYMRRFAAIEQGQPYVEPPISHDGRISADMKGGLEGTARA